MERTRRELVRRAIEFDAPWRMPVCSSPMVTTFTDDVVYLFPEMQGNKYWTGEGGDDEWGCRWELSSVTKDMGQVVGHPLKDLRALKTLPRPNGKDPRRYQRLDAELARAEDRYVVFCNGTCMFERAHMLRGFARFFEDLYDDPEGVDALLDFVVQYHFDSVDYLVERFPGRIQAYRVTDDWGTQQGPMIGTDLFRRFFFPRYQRLFARCHQAGMHVWLHSCGKHEALLEQLVEAGLDVANLCQPAIFDIPSFGKQFAGRLAFEAGGDTQKTLVQGDPRAIRQEAAALLRNWTTDKGGWLLMTELAAESNGIAPETGDIMIQAFQAEDRWKDKGPENK